LRLRLMLRRCRSRTGEEAECILRLMDDSDAHENLINFPAFLDVLAASSHICTSLCTSPRLLRRWRPASSENAFVEVDG